MNNSGNQIRNYKIKQYPKTDREKLAGIERYIHEKYPNDAVILEGFIMFTKGEDEYAGIRKDLTLEDAERYNVHPFDVGIIHNGSLLLFELDGPIHDIKTEKTISRNKKYKLNNIPYIVINETELKLKLDIPKSRPLTQEQINQEFDEKLSKL